MKKYKFPLSILFSVLMLTALLAACTSETEEYVQGYWYRGNAHFMDEWYFDAGNFSHKSEVFHGDPNITSGRYRVLEFADDRLVIELYDIDLSFGDETQQITIKIDTAADTIRISGQDYERTLP